MELVIVEEKILYCCKYCNYNFTTHNHKIMHENRCPYRGVKIGYKFCSACGNEILLKNFSRSKVRYDNLNGQCKECAKTYYKKWLSNILSPIGNK